MLAREELGKGALLIALFVKASKGQAITFGEVSAQLRDHRAKQVAALYSIPLFAERGTPLADLMDESRKELAAALPPASESASFKMTATRELAKVVLERAAAPAARATDTPGNAVSTWIHRPENREDDAALCGRDRPDAPGRGRGGERSGSEAHTDAAMSVRNRYAFS